MEIIERLEHLPGWTEYKRVISKEHGPLRMKTMFPVHSNFWSMWKTPSIKLEMEKAGYTLRKVKDGRWMAFRLLAWIGETAKIRLEEESRAGAANVELIRPLGLEYLPFQKAGVKYAVERLKGLNGQRERDAVLIADQPGLGKTIQAIGIANQDPRLQELKILIVCPASLKKNWQNEMRKWLVDGIGHNVAIVKNRWPDQFNNAFIVNYDVLEKWQAEIRETEWDLVIYDEAHYMKNEDARRTVFAMGGVVKGKKEPGMDEDDRPMIIVQPIKARKTVFLTGTPMENGKAKEMWPMIQKCDPDGLGRSKRKFIERYGVTDENFEELQQVMRTMFMVRRMKEDVLKDLPPKLRSVMALDPEEWGVKALFDEEMRIFKEYQDAIRSWGVQAEMAKLGGKAHYKEVIKSKKAKLGLTLGDMARMRKEGAIAKVPGFMQQVMVKIEEGKRPLLFAHHKAVLSHIEEACQAAGLRVGRIDGDVPPDRRQGLVDQFQRGELDVMVLGIIPAGVGLTLTASDTVMFCELDWIPGRMGQCEDRAHRIGQKDTVWVFHVVMEGSLDELMAKRLVEKQDRIERALDTLAEWDEDEEDDNEHAAIEAAAGAPSSKGYSVDKIEKDAEKMSKACYDAAVAAIRLIAGGASGFGSIDVEICQKILDRGEVDRNAAALGRKIAMRNKWALDDEITKHMEFPITKKEAA